MATVLVHCASVGEFNALRGLLTSLKNQYPHEKIIVCSTNINVAQFIDKLDVELGYELSVIDTFHLRFWQLTQLRPKLICIMETEIWPNMLWIARMKKIPIVFLNARLSDRSFRKYKLLAGLIRFLGSSVKEINCQSIEDQVKFSQVFQGKIYNSGNLKFSNPNMEYNLVEVRAHWKIQPDQKIVVFGSSRPGEEMLIARHWEQLKLRIPKLRLIIAPRHPERTNEVLEAFKGFECSTESNLDLVQDIHIIDVLGLLNMAYCICDVAIVGGSFYDYGGHNPLEPAYYSKPIIIGSYHSSCKESVKQLHDSEAIIISAKESIVTSIVLVLCDAELSTRMGKAASKVIDNNAQALTLHLDSIGRWI